jgi:hypothetical protein
LVARSLGTSSGTTEVASEVGEKKIFLRDFWLVWNLAPTRARSRLGTSSGTTELEKKNFSSRLLACLELSSVARKSLSKVARSLGTSSGTTEVASEVGEKKFFFATSGLFGT